MKNRYFILLCVISLMLSCNSNNKTSHKSKDAKTSFRYYEGHLQSIQILSDKEFITTQYYDNGVPQSIAFLKDSLLNGAFCTFYKSGKIEMKGNYVNNVRDGMWYYYSEDGYLSKKIEFIADLSTESQWHTNQCINYTKDMNVDLTKLNNSFDLYAFQDTIYYGEPYNLKINYAIPYYPYTMDLVIGDLDKKFELRNGTQIDTIHCNGLEHTFSTMQYKKGNNVLRGLIYNFNKTKTECMQSCFTVQFYVKELPFIKQSVIDSVRKAK